MFTFKGNRAFGCQTFLKMEAPHTAKVLIEDNHGFNIAGEMFDIKVFVDPNKLNAFLAEVQPHMHELEGEQLAAFEAIIEKLIDPRVEDKSGPLAQLASFGESVASGVLSTVIAGFLG